jgi:carboxylate-amine ligase
VAEEGSGDTGGAPQPLRSSVLDMHYGSGPPLTLGVEEEFQLLDASTFALVSRIDEVLERVEGTPIAGRIHPELMESVVEAASDVCRTIDDVRREVTQIRRGLGAILKPLEMRLCGAGTHAFSHAEDQRITSKDRYRALIEQLQYVARREVVFGMHVHVAIPDADLCMDVMEGVLVELPVLLALSANSPFWIGLNTGLRSYRCKVFDKFPRTNIPDTFSSWADYESFVNLLVKTNSIDNAKKIWWDIRPHPFFSTVEVRICDIPMRADESLALAALIQATMVKLYKLHSRNQGFRMYSRALIMENKWRASRYGLNGKLIDFGQEKEVPARELMLEYLEFVDDVLDELDSRSEVEYVHTMLKNGCGAERQLQVFEETQDLKKVVQYMVSETAAGL